ncbi:MAG: hypothetical protein ACYTG5_06570 [Planctomycetota bacterium]|jgi:hypothetical protein
MAISIRQYLPLSILLTALLLGGLPAQRTIIVDAAGRHDFTELQPAIDAAGPGDIIRVRRGRYDAGARIDKAVRIIGERECTVACLDPRVEIHGKIEVVNLARHETVILTDLYSVRVNPPVSHTNSSLQIHARDSLGSIHLQDLAAEYVLEDCSYVTFNRANGVGQPAVEAVRSRVVVTSSGWLCLRGNIPTLEAVDSEIVLFGSSLSVVHSHAAAGAPVVRLTDTGLTLGGDTDLNVNCQTVPFGLPCPPEVVTLGNSVVSSSLEGGVLIDEANDGQLGITVEKGKTAKFVALVASLPAQPIETGIGTFYNDPRSSLILNFGEMDEELRIPAFAGNNRLGIPLTFQAAMVLDNNQVVLSLPHTAIF